MEMDKNRPNKLSELYLIADIIFDIFVLLVLSAIFGPIIEKIVVMMVEKIAGLISGIWVISIIALIVLCILTLLLNETIYNYSIRKLTERRVEIDKDIEEINQHIAKLIEELSLYDELLELKKDN